MASYDRYGKPPTRIRQLRHQRGLSLRGLAGAAGLHPSRLSRIERGLFKFNATPRVGELAKLAKHLEVDWVTLVEPEWVNQASAADAPSASSPQIVQP